MQKELYKKIDAYIESEAENIIKDLSELVKIPSVNGAASKDYPFGEAVDKALQYASELYVKNGFDMQVKSEAGYAVYQSNMDREHSIGIFAHADVVPVNAEDWILTAPFAPKVIDGFLVGRGSEDNKAGIVAALYALKALKEAGVWPSSGITVFAGGHEESGMKDIEAFVKAEKMPAMNFVPDTGFPYSQGEKGYARVHCISENALTDICEYKGGEAYNIVLADMNIKLRYDESVYEALKAVGADVTADNDSIYYNQKGIPGHAAAPDGTCSAAYLAAEKLCAVEGLYEQDKKILKAVKTMLSDSYGEKLGIAGSDVFGKLTAANGMVDIVDGKLMFTLDIRYGTSFTGEQIIQSLQENLKEYGFTVEVIQVSDGFLLEENKELEDAMQKAFWAFGGSAENKPFKSVGGTYARHLCNAYSTGIMLPCSKEKLGLPKGHGAVHQSDECIDIKAYLQGIKIFTAMLYEADCMGRK